MAELTVSWKGYILAVVCDKGRMTLESREQSLFEFKTACIVAVDYFMKSKPLHACLLTYSHKINIKTTCLDEFGRECPFTKKQKTA